MMLRIGMAVLVVMMVACSSSSSSAGVEGEGEAGEGEASAEGEQEGQQSFEFRQQGAVVTMIDFGNAEIGAAVVERELIIVNTGTVAIPVLSQPAMLLGGANADSFVISQQPTATSIAVGGQLAVRVALSPVDVGALEGLLLFAYGVQENERGVLTLRGTGTGSVAQPGVASERYDGVFSVLPDFDVLTPALSETRTNFSISDDVVDNFAFRFRGQIAVPTDGEWTWFTTSDDGSRLLIDGAVVVDNDGLHGPREATGVVSLTGGRHDIEVQFFEQGGGEVLSVEWLGPGVARAAVPDAVLFE
jgi:hypothetical protein